MKKITLLLAAMLSFNFGISQFLEDFNGATFPPSGWAVYDGANGLGTAEQWKQGGTAPEFYALSLWEAVTAGQVAQDWIVTPLIPVNAMQNELTFDANDNNVPEYGSTLSVRVSTTSQTATASFTEVLLYNETALGAGTGPISFTIDLTAYLNQSVYIAFVHTNNDGDAVTLDNISVDAAPACGIPSNLSFVTASLSSTTVDLTWSNTGDFDLRYGQFPYAVRDMGSTGTVTAGNSYQLTGLTPGVSYNVFVRQNCATAGLISDWEEILVGTLPDASVSFPFSEDLEPDANQALLLNLGISFFTNSNDWQFGQDDLTDGDTTNDRASNGISFFFSNNTFTNADADATLFFGPFTLATGNQYTFSFDQRNSVISDATTPNKDIELIAAATNDGTTNTVLATFDDMNNTTYQARSGSFSPTTSGDYYFGIRDKSGVLVGVAAGNSVFVDAITISSTLSVDDFSESSLQSFFNSRTNSLNIEISQGLIEHVEIYNLLGQQVANQKANESSISIKMEAAPAGVYIAKVTFEGTTQSVKFIKK
jgi:VCBS repeat-containing protein